jgi:hypothetical protein
MIQPGKRRFFAALIFHPGVEMKEIHAFLESSQMKIDFFS